MNTPNQNREGMQQFFKLANAHDVDGVASMVHDDYVGESDVLPAAIVGREAYRALLKGFWGPFPDTSYHVEQMLADGDTVITRVRLAGSQHGEFMGKKGAGQRFSVRICHVDEWKDGKIKRAWYYWDTGTLMRQLGVPV